MSLLEKSKAYKPFQYPWAHELWDRQRKIMWIPDEVALGDDIKDWNTNLSDSETNFLLLILRFFTQSDVDVAGSYTSKYLPYFKPTEVSMMLLAFSYMETIHISAYSRIIETLGMPDSEFGEFVNYKQMVDKHDLVSNFSMDTPQEALKSLAVYGAFTEGLQLFGSFIMLLNLPRFGKMRGLGQIITWSMRDESLHVDGLLRLFHQFSAESGVYDAKLKREIRDIADEVVKIEHNFIDLLFESGDQNDLTAAQVKDYIRYLCDCRLNQLAIKPIFKMREFPLPWLRSMLNADEHANFFETQPSDYSVAATTGDWDSVWFVPVSK